MELGISAPCSWHPIPTYMFPLPHSPWSCTVPLLRHCSLPDLGLWPQGPFSPTPPFSSMQGIAWNFQGTLFRAMSGCWVTEQLLFFLLRVGNEQSDIQDCILLHMRVVVIISWELLLEHPPTNCSVGVQNTAGWNLRLELLICAFHTLNCLLTALPTGPNCILWAKKKFGWPPFHWNFVWIACCCCCSKFCSFCFISLYYSTWIWDLGSLDDTSTGNYVQFYIKGLDHLCGTQIYTGVLRVKGLLALAPDMVSQAEECWLSTNVSHLHLSEHVFSWPVPNAPAGQLCELHVFTSLHCQCLRTIICFGAAV